MDSKMRIKTAAEPLKEQRVKTQWIRLIILALIPCYLFLIPSCKQNKWVDWKVQNEIWLEQNKKKEGVKEKDGLQYKIIADPTPNDARPNPTSTIVCDYTVKLINGYQVDAGSDVSLNLANCIPGFTKGCHLIHNNGDIELYIPCSWGYDAQKYAANDEYNAEGYGTEGTSGYIPPYSTLIYTVHISSVIGD